MKVLVACEFSGRVREAFSKLGHEAWSCDLLPNETEDSRHHYQGDIFDFLGHKDWDLMIAHPPCTALCVTGNRHYVGTRERENALEFVKRLMDAPIEKIAIENPVGVISSRIKPPTQYINPWQFGHSVNKKTGLWLKNLPPLVPTNIVPKDDHVVHKSGKRTSKWYYETSLLPLKQRGHARSITFQGIADAMAEQWSNI